jgi:RNA polymerase sigma-70 factor (ECF subfamily)
MVFNLYAVDGYRHNEIAEMLGISEGTSRSQLNAARQQLKMMLSRLGIQRIDQLIS